MPPRNASGRTATSSVAPISRRGNGLFDLVRLLPDTLRYENHVILAEGDYVIAHGRFSDHGRPRSWIGVVKTLGPCGHLLRHGPVRADRAGHAATGAVLAATAATFQDMVPLLPDLLVLAFKSSVAGPGAEVRLERRLSGLELVGPAAIAPSHSPLAAQISPQPFRVTPNTDGVDSVSFRFGSGVCQFELADNCRLHRIDVGLGRWIEHLDDRWDVAP